MSAENKRQTYPYRCPVCGGDIKTMTRCASCSEGICYNGHSTPVAKLVKRGE
jgi:hypothetical protein